MKRFLILMLALLLFVSLSFSVSAATDVPLVYFITGVENQIDTILVAKIESFGFKVEVHSHEDYNIEDAKKAAVIYVSESVSSGNIANFFNDVAVPFVSSEAYIADDMLITDITADVDFGVGAFTSVKIVKPDHPLIKDLPSTFDIWKGEGATPTWQLVNDKNSIAVASDDPTHTYVVCYEKGDPSKDGSYNMPEKRIFMNWHTTMIEGLYNDNMVTLLKNSLIYAVGFDPLAPVEPEVVPEAVAETPAVVEDTAAPVKENPKTGDEIIFMVSLMLLSCAAVTYIYKNKLSSK